jgi:nucleotide-binding universal stress UspA family protein
MKLLCATDLKPKTDAAVDRASQIRRALDARLSLVHVVSPLGADEGTLEQRLLVASSRLAQRARHAEAEAELVVRCGRAASVVSGESVSANLVVIGPHEPDAVGDALAGTFTGKLLSAARCPVLVTRRPGAEPYRRVLLALDGSDATGRVVRAAEGLPVADEPSFGVVHAHEPPYEAMMNTVGVGNRGIATYASASMSQAATLIHSQLRMHSLDWRRYRVMLVDARPGPAIRKAMTEMNPDLLVMGTRGHGRFRRALLGSTAHEMLAAADCDVLLVPDAALRGKDGADANSGPRAA